MPRQLTTSHMPRWWNILLFAITLTLVWTSVLRAEEGATQEQRLARGKQYYEKLCAGCHSLNGKKGYERPELLIDATALTHRPGCADV